MKQGKEQALVRWAKFLSIEEGEGPLAGWMVALFATSQASQGLAANAADALFFLRFGVEDLPVMIVFSGVAVMIAVTAHSVGLAGRGARGWLWVVTMAAAIWSAVGWASVALNQRWVYAFIWVSTQAIIWVTFTMMWNAAEAACTTRQAKRLFPLFATGGVVGGIVGNALTGPLAAGLGTQHLLLAQALLLSASAVLLIRVGTFFPEEGKLRGLSMAADMGRTLTTAGSNRLLRLAAVAAVLMSLLWFMVIFPFSEAVTASFPDEARLAGFLGIFSSIATGLTFLVSLMITKRLFARLGVVMSLLIVPLVYVAGFSLWLAAFGLTTAALVRGLQWVTTNAIGSTAYTALFNVVPGRRRGQVMGLMTAIPGQVGTIIAGLFLITAGSLSAAFRFGGGLLVALGLLATVLAMRPAYRAAIVRAVEDGLVGVFSVPLRAVTATTDGVAFRVLTTALQDPRPDTRLAALSALTRLKHPDSVNSIAPLMSDHDTLVRAGAFTAMCSVQPDHILRRAAEAINDPEPEVRLRVLHALRFEGDFAARQIARPLIADPDPRVAVAAAGVVGAREGHDAVSSLLAVASNETVGSVLEELALWPDLSVDTSPYLTHPRPRVRKAAAAFADRLDPALLLPLLDDPSLQVRHRAAHTLSLSDQGLTMLMEVLRSGSFHATDVALRAITPMETLDPGFTGWASSEARRVVRLRTMAQALDSRNGSASSEFLGKVLARRADRVEEWVRLATSTSRTRGVMPVLERGLSSPNPETRAQAIEALETTGDRSALHILLPLLEPTSDVPPPDRRRALIELTRDWDPWIRALASRSLTEHGADAYPSVAATDGMPTLAEVNEDFDHISLMDRVIALHRVPMFDGLDPEDLELIARNTTEVHFEPLQKIYMEGDDATEMLVIVKGTALISHSHGHRREPILSYGAGEHVGELALLSGDRRAADVVAGEEGITGIIISKDDLLSILEERPQVALGMLATLSSRLASQTHKLGHEAQTDS